MEKLLLFFPLISSIICGVLNKKISHRVSAIIAIFFMLSTSIIAVNIFIASGLGGVEKKIILFDWFKSGILNISWNIYLDQLAAIMVLTVSLISTLIHIYSIEYMHEDPALPRFISYLSLFTFFMLLLVTSANLIQLFCGWEGVGFCSYLLIGFWYKKSSANNAAYKAFIVNRIGDFAFVLAIALIFAYFKSVEFSEIFKEVGVLKSQTINILHTKVPLLEVIAFLILIGSMGKSAQIGLHIWLPDAMEGPTPVSALIHAATMVTAGIFLVSRCSAFYEYTRYASQFLIIIGAVTCIFAATIACVQNDIKKIIAFSTCSQLGYMFMASGFSAYHGAIFHLFTHAFFKALLFLAAGSVIHACSDEQDIRKMGGLWNKIPITYCLFWVGTLAIMGIFPFAGHYSKDLILEAAYASDNSFNKLGYFIGTLSAGFTGFYSIRLMLFVFHGKNNLDKNKYFRIHESSIIMLIPMAILAIGAFFAGIYGVYGLDIADIRNGYFNNSLIIVKEYPEHEIPNIIILLPMITSIIGGLLSLWLHYLKAQGFKVSGVLYNIILNKYYIDEIYDFLFVKPYCFFASLIKVFDMKVLDKFGPDGIAYVVYRITNLVSKLQTGFIYNYAFYYLIGILLSISFIVQKTYIINL